MNLLKPFIDNRKNVNDDLLDVFMKPERKDIKPGMYVAFIQKHHQRTGEITEGVVKSILTSAPTHPHGIKIMTDEKKVGRVVEILEGLD